MTNSYLLSEGFVSVNLSLYIITKFVVVSKVGIKRVVCIYFQEQALKILFYFTATGVKCHVLVVKSVLYFITVQFLFIVLWISEPIIVF